DPGGGLNAALDAAAQDATRSGYDRLIVLPGDLADPKADEIAQLLALPSQEGSAVVAPSYDGGTNALVLNPPSGFTFRYGPNSSAAHEKAARDAGRAVVIAPFASLRHDVDVAADLNAAVVRRIGQGLGGDR
ncbi:MAG: NTP transferase domain-containing protein, partial [Devosiaceae bacterium]|nr:NTP transferase domain-containing protein [Devosiaceae bacterium MH13]